MGQWEDTGKVRDREDAFANRRDACATHKSDLAISAIIRSDPDA
jgi:hypothetical protein